MIFQAVLNFLQNERTCAERFFADYCAKTMSDITPEEHELSKVLWDLHFTTGRIVDSVVDDFNILPSDISSEIDATFRNEFNTGIRRQKRGCRNIVTEQLQGSTTFQRLILQAKVIKYKMQGTDIYFLF